MAFSKSAYVATIKAALDKAVTDNGGTAPPENQDIADALGDALQTGISELQIATAAAIGTSGAQGVTAGAAAVPVLSAPGEIT